MKGFVLAVLLLCAGLAGAQGMPPPGGRSPASQERWEERRRLKDEVRGGRMTRDDAVRQYREKYPERLPEHERRRFTPEEREQLRRDVMEANRNFGKR